MSCGFTMGWEVRWRDGHGRHRSKRFREALAARKFDASIHDHNAGEPAKSRHGSAGGVCLYATRAGTRWRYDLGRSDGSMTRKRGSRARPQPAMHADAQRNRLLAARSSTRRRRSGSSGSAGLHGAGCMSRQEPTGCLGVRRPPAPSYARACPVGATRCRAGAQPDGRMDRVAAGRSAGREDDQQHARDAGRVLERRGCRRVTCREPFRSGPRLPAAHVEQEYFRPQLSFSLSQALTG